MLRVLVFSMLIALFLGCNPKNIDPHKRYSADFVNSRIDEVEVMLDKFAKQNNLAVFRKDRERMKVLSKGEDAFFTALYFKGDPILIVTNVGVPSVLIVTASDYGSVPVAELEGLTNSLVKKIELKIGAAFVENKQTTGHAGNR